MTPFQWWCGGSLVNSAADTNECWLMLLSQMFMWNVFVEEKNSKSMRRKNMLQLKKKKLP